jgi:hypothetical protein
MIASQSPRANDAIAAFTSPLVNLFGLHVEFTAYSEAIPYDHLNWIAPDKRCELNRSMQHHLIS